MGHTLTSYTHIDMLQEGDMWTGMRFANSGGFTKRAPEDMIFSEEYSKGPPTSRKRETEVGDKMEAVV
jgi:hypothetical protein